MKQELIDKAEKLLTERLRKEFQSDHAAQGVAFDKEFRRLTGEVSKLVPEVNKLLDERFALQAQNGTVHFSVAGQPHALILMEITPTPPGYIHIFMQGIQRRDDQWHLRFVEKKSFAWKHGSEVLSSAELAEKALTQFLDQAHRVLSDTGTS